MTIEDAPTPPVEWLRSLAARRRFGVGDRRGSANLIDDAARERARLAIRSAASVGLARPLVGGPSTRDDGRPAFALEVFHHDGIIMSASDHVEFDCHGGANTHLDAHNHMGLDGTWYNGWMPGDPLGPSVAEFAGGLVTRAVYLDIPSVRGTPWIEVDHPVTGADLDAALDRAEVTFAPGDALLLDMGRDRFEAAGEQSSRERRPGIGLDGAHWIADHDVALLCWDFLDAFHPREAFVPVHLLLWAIGLLLVDNCDFSRLRHALVPGQITGALVIAPLPIAGATGNNVNPIVVL